MTACRGFGVGGISPDAIEDVLTFGREHHDRHGGVILSFDRVARRRLTRVTGARHAGTERLQKVYVVVTDGVIATGGHRTRRLRRH